MAAAATALRPRGPTRVHSRAAAGQGRSLRASGLNPHGRTATPRRTSSRPSRRRGCAAAGGALSPAPGGGTAGPRIPGDCGQRHAQPGETPANVAPAAPFKMGIADAMAYALMLAPATGRIAADVRGVCATARTIRPWNYRGIIAASAAGVGKPRNSSGGPSSWPLTTGRSQQPGQRSPRRKEYGRGGQSLRARARATSRNGRCAPQYGQRPGGQDRTSSDRAYQHALALSPDMVQNTSVWARFTTPRVSASRR